MSETMPYSTREGKEMAVLDGRSRGRSCRTHPRVEEMSKILPYSTSTPGQQKMSKISCTPCRRRRRVREKYNSQVRGVEVRDQTGGPGTGVQRRRTSAVRGMQRRPHRPLGRSEGAARGDPAGAGGQCGTAPGARACAKATGSPGRPGTGGRGPQGQEEPDGSRDEEGKQCRERRLA